MLNTTFSYYLYKRGISWTPLILEDFLPLLAIALRRNSKRLSAALSLFVFAMKLIYFEFNIDPILVYYTGYGKIFYLISSLAILAILYSSLKRTRGTSGGRVGWRKLAYAILVISGIILTDKFASHDKLMSSVVVNPATIAARDDNIVPNDNIVFRSIGDDLASGNGAILIIWESLGIPADGSLVENLKRLRLASVQEIDWTRGGTVTAEIRYLCGSYNGYSSEKCLPRRAKTSYAFHGNSMAYFNRTAEYARIGFGSAYGKDFFVSHKYELCDYYYTAGCDKDLFTLVFKRAEQENCSGFYYGLTIDAHFPFSKYHDHPKGLFADLEHFISVAKAFKSSHPKCRIYVAGDHPPPLSSKFSRKKTLFLEI